MKKLLAVIVLASLIGACMPAGADSCYLHAGGGVLDLSKNSFEFSWKSYESEYSPFYEKDEVRILYALIFALETGVIREITYEDLHGSVYGEIYGFSLDGDETVDIILTTKFDLDGKRTNRATIEAAAEASCGPVYMIDSGTAAVPVDYETPDMFYYSPLLIIFPGGSEVCTDKTGTYELSGDGAAFVKPPKAGTSAKIPATITVGKSVFPVTKIADNAFKGNKKLTKVTIGKNVKEIGKNAFANCAKLKTVSGGANVEIIGDSAFAGCKALKSFTVGAKVKSIGKKAFSKCAALKKITIKSTLLNAKNVGANAFKGINASATIKVPKAVKKEYTKWLLKKGVKKTMKIK